MINSRGSHQHVWKEVWEGEGSQSLEGMDTVRHPQVPGHPALQGLLGPLRTPQRGAGPYPCLLKDSSSPPYLNFPDNRMEKTKVMSCTCKERCTAHVVFPDSSVSPLRSTWDISPEIRCQASNHSPQLSPSSPGYQLEFLAPPNLADGTSFLGPELHCPIRQPLPTCGYLN